MVRSMIGHARRNSGVAAFFCGVLLIVGVLVFVASERSWRRSGYDGTPVQLVIGSLPASSVGCQPHEPIPAGTRAVRIQASPSALGSAAARVQLRGAGAYSGVGSLGSVLAGGAIVAPLPHVVTQELVTTLCVWNTGQVPLALAGAAVGPADRLIVTAVGKPSVPLVGRVRVEDLISSHPSSLWPELGKLGDRIETATGSPLAPWLVAIGLFGALVATMALLWEPEEANGEAGDADEI
jgi:hypothetical protein